MDDSYAAISDLRRVAASRRLVAVLLQLAASDRFAGTDYGRHFADTILRKPAQMSG
jgi:hypothetical protein